MPQSCHANGSCNGMHSCRYSHLKDNSVGMDDMKKKREAAAMRHPNTLGAGAEKRKSLPAKEKIGVVEKEFKRGTLHSGSGAKVTNPKQAIAIALSEARKAGAHIPEKRKDILPTPEYKNTLKSYGLSSLKNNNGAVTSPQQARQIAGQRSGQSYNQHMRDFKNADRFGMKNRGKK
jgi:hypothetical protein